MMATITAWEYVGLGLLALMVGSIPVGFGLAIGMKMAGGLK